MLARAAALKPNDPELQLHRAYLHFNMTGSTGAIRETLKASDPAHDSDNAGFARWDVNMLDRRFQDAVAEIQKSAMTKFEVETAIYPKELLCALALWATGDFDSARPYFERSRSFMEPEVEKNSGGSRLRVALAMAYAGLGEKAEAVEQARLAKEQRSPEKDAVAGPPIAVSVARVYVMVGEKQEAVRELAPLLKMPFGISLMRARLDPCWDPLRGTSEFEQILR